MIISLAIPLNFKPWMTQLRYYGQIISWHKLIYGKHTDLVKSLCFHACPHNCIVFRDSDSFQFGNLQKCPKCGSNRYLSKNIPRKHFIYLLLGPRFARLYGTASLVAVLHALPVEASHHDVMADMQHSPIWQTREAGDKGAVILQ